MSEYAPLVMMLLIAGVFAGALPVVSALLGRSRPSERKLLPYECGIIPEQEAIGPVSVKFGVTAMLFLLFDVEVIFFYPWAAAFGQMGLFALLEMLLFMAILLVGYLYVWKRGAFEWEL
ncbi:MAG: NADH-quinone oxidoreductase subunit A [Fimbriimonadaceae bacterium]|nr:NADH-quinone oxidoreductase subunit A [Fimbriimonadaceae bacterium]